MSNKIQKIAKRYSYILKSVAQASEDLPPMSIKPSSPQTIHRKLERVLGSDSPVTVWFGNHMRGYATSGADFDHIKFISDFSTLPKKTITEADVEYLKEEIKKGFGGRLKL